MHKANRGFSPLQMAKGNCTFHKTTAYVMHIAIEICPGIAAYFGFGNQPAGLL
jgi:hypothetical protein